MSSTTSASLLGIGRSALLTSQAGLGAVGRNIANSATPGYSRLDTVLSEWVGGGVAALKLAAIRDQIVESRLRDADASSAAPDARHTTLARVEDLLQGANGSQLQDGLDKLFSAFSDLSSNPSGRTERDQVQAAAASLVSTFHNLANASTQIVNDANSSLSDQINAANTSLSQVADLDKLIAAAPQGSADRESLIDQRNQLLRTVSGTVGVEVVAQGNDSVQVSLPGGPVLVDGDRVTGTLALDLSSSTQAKIDVVSPGGGTGLDITNLVTGGSIAGLLQARNTDLPAFSSQLDALAASVVSEVNALHSPGTNANGGNNDFFLSTGVTAGTIALDPAIAADSNNISAGTSGNPGDNSVALAIAALADTAVSIGGSAPQTFSSYVAGVSADVGERSKEAQDAANYASGLVAALEDQRAQVSGVSLDEEGTKLLGFQRSYQAAAKFVTSVDETTQATLAML